MANITQKDVIIAIAAGLIGFGGGAAFVGATKASQLADDVHEVKQDFDKSKGRLAKDYVHTADKVHEVLDNVDTAEIGRGATTGVKKLGKEAADGVREIGGTWKEKLKAAAESKIKSKSRDYTVVAPPRGTSDEERQQWLEKEVDKAEKLLDSDDPNPFGFKVVVGGNPSITQGGLAPGIRRRLKERIQKEYEKKLHRLENVK